MRHRCESRYRVDFENNFSWLQSLLMKCNARLDWQLVSINLLCVSSLVGSFLVHENTKLRLKHRSCCNNRTIAPRNFQKRCETPITFLVIKYSNKLQSFCPLRKFQMVATLLRSPIYLFLTLRSRYGWEYSTRLMNREFLQNGYWDQGDASLRLAAIMSNNCRFRWNGSVTA